VDNVIFGYQEDRLKVLVIKCNMPPYVGEWSLLGELVKANEDLDDAAYRILHQWTDVEDIHLKQVQTFGRVERHPAGRVVTVAYYSLIKVNENDHGKEKYAHWVDLTQLDSMAFDHLQVLDACLNRLRHDLMEDPRILRKLIPERFTLSKLQKLYEAILGKKLDKRNFRKRLLGQNVVLETDEVQINVAHRPAKLFSFQIK